MVRCNPRALLMCYLFFEKTTADSLQIQVEQLFRKTITEEQTEGNTTTAEFLRAWWNIGEGNGEIHARTSNDEHDTSTCDQLLCGDLAATACTSSCREFSCAKSIAGVADAVFLAEPAEDDTSSNFATTRHEIENAEFWL